MTYKGNISKAIAIIDSLKSSGDGLSLQDISNITGINKTTAYRICSVLYQYNILYKENTTKIYKLGPKFIEWIFVFKDNLKIYKEIENILRVISNKIGETVTIFRKRGFERECVFRFEVNEKLRYSIKVGERLPINKGAGGKVILAFLEKDELNRYIKKLKLSETDKAKLLEQLKEIREKKFYFSFGERDPYIAAFSVPLFNAEENNIIGSLSISGPLNRFKERFKDKHIEFVKSKVPYIELLMNLERDYDT